MIKQKYKDILREKYGVDDPALLSDHQRWQAYESLKKYIQNESIKSGWQSGEYKKRIAEIVEFLDL